MEFPVKAQRKGERVWLSLLLWVAFAAGLVVQGFAPHLKIQDHKFVIPSSLLSGDKDVRPDEMVARERTMQAVSGILTLGSALGLGFYYRRVLFPRANSRGGE